MPGDTIGVLQPAPVPHPGQDVDLGARESLDLTVRLLDGDVGVGVPEHHQRVVVVGAQPGGSSSISPGRTDRYNFSTARRVLAGIRWPTTVRTQSRDSPGFSRASSLATIRGLSARMDSSPSRGVCQIRAIRCQR